MESFAIIIFGITSNLAQIKLIPALYDMEEKGLLPRDASIIGIARKPLSDADLIKHINVALHAENRHHQHKIDKAVEARLAKRFHYVQGEANTPEVYQSLQLKIDRLGIKNRIFYLATYPNLYQAIFENLKQSGMTKPQVGWARLMIEKPIGNDLASAQSLNALLLDYFDENQVYRLDHYLGKETLQNILTFRFGNGIFEPLMNNEHIDHIQVTAAEDFGIGARGGYYDTVGALKDVGQNHLLQMVAFATMDAPEQFSNDHITKQRVNVLQALKPHPESLVLGQYVGYRNEPHVDPHSKADTYFAFKTEVQTPRLKNIPIYVRGGKKLQQTATEISVVFKTPQNRLFRHLDCGNEPNVLIYRIQPNEAVVLKILAKRPGHDLELEPDYMQFCYGGERRREALRAADAKHPMPYREKANDLPDAYEKLLLDAIRGDQTFFNHAAEVEAEWEFVDEIIKSQPPRLHLYKAGTWGPQAADEMIQKDGRVWLEPSMAFCQI